MRTLGVWFCAFFLFVIAYDIEAYSKRYLEQCVPHAKEPTP
jgi:hypothetical protein